MFQSFDKHCQQERLGERKRKREIYDMEERSKKWRIVWQSDYRQTESLLKQGGCKKVLMDQN